MSQFAKYTESNLGLVDRETHKTMVPHFRIGSWADRLEREKDARERAAKLDAHARERREVLARLRRECAA